MSLPKHNPLLRFLYVALVLFMFAFMMMVIRMYWPDDTQVNEYDAYSDYSTYETDAENSQLSKAVAPAQTPLNEARDARVTSQSAVNEKNNGSQPELFRRPKFTVTGMERSLNLSTDMQPQLESLWADFYNLDTQQYLPGLSRSDKVYVIYKSYDHNTQSIEVLIGYQYAMQKLSNQVKSVELPNGQYIKRDSVLATWDNPQDLALKYKLDYEVYELDEYFNIGSQRAFLSTHNGDH